MQCSFQKPLLCSAKEIQRENDGFEGSNKQNFCSKHQLRNIMERGSTPVHLYTLTTLQVERACNLHKQYSAIPGKAALNNSDTEFLGGGK